MSDDPPFLVTCPRCEGRAIEGSGMDCTWCRAGDSNFPTGKLWVIRYERRESTDD